LAVREAPDELPGAGVERERAPRLRVLLVARARPAGREVDEAAEDGRGARDRRARVVRPPDRARRLRERVEAVVVGADVGDPARKRGRGVDEAPGLGRPERPAVTGREDVDATVGRAD